MIHPLTVKVCATLQDPRADMLSFALSFAGARYMSRGPRANGSFSAHAVGLVFSGCRHLYRVGDPRQTFNKSKTSPTPGQGHFLPNQVWHIMHRW